MDVKLTKSTDALFCVLYKEYLDRIKKKIPRSEAVEMGGIFDIQELAPKLSEDSIIYICKEELAKIGFLKLSVADDCFINSEITPNGIRYMENRFKNDINEILDFLGKIKSAVPFL